MNTEAKAAPHHSLEQRRAEAVRTGFVKLCSGDAGEALGVTSASNMETEAKAVQFETPSPPTQRQRHGGDHPPDFVAERIAKTPLLRASGVP